MTAVPVAPAPAAPAIYECRITHARTEPLRNVFSYRSYQWLVDLDHLPRPSLGLRLLAGFRSQDHFADPRRSIRENLDGFLASRGIDLRGGQVFMLAHARVLGYVFNPLTVYWCHRAAGPLECVVAEVHNTYRQRHCYLLRTDSRGRAETAKELYVSPFFGVDGTYRMRLPEPGSRLALTVVLVRPGRQPFVASVHGTRIAVGPGRLVAAAIRHPWSTAVVAGRIRWQGIKLHARGLPVHPRPQRAPQDAGQLPPQPDRAPQEGAA